MAQVLAQVYNVRDRLLTWLLQWKGICVNDGPTVMVKSWAYHCIMPSWVVPFLTGSENRFKFRSYWQCCRPTHWQFYCCNSKSFSRKDTQRPCVSHTGTQSAVFLLLTLGSRRSRASLFRPCIQTEGHRTIHLFQTASFSWVSFPWVSRFSSWDHTRGSRKLHRKLLNFSF